MLSELSPDSVVIVDKSQSKLFLLQLREYGKKQRTFRECFFTKCFGNANIIAIRRAFNTVIEVDGINLKSFF
jgi:hypothetical protein